MPKSRQYQYNYSSLTPAMFNTSMRERKAATMAATLKDYHGSTSKLDVLDIGASTGIIDNFLATHFNSVLGIDIDQDAITSAKRSFKKDNLSFLVGDALNIKQPDNLFDVVICSQIYEHVPNAQKMMDEILRVLRPGGVCYFAASNRIMWNEPHYHLPMLSLIPRKLAHLYLRLSGKGMYYHELHFTYWGLKKLVRSFEIIDYTAKLIEYPEFFKTDYMIKPGSFKQTSALWIVKNAEWLSPGFVWLLRKPDSNTHSQI